MPLSRRSFLWNSLGTAAAASTLGQLPQVAFGRTLSAARETARPILLDSNENAYGPSTKVQTAMHTALRLANRYPIEAHHSLIEQIAAFHRVSPGQVIVGCGSTEILRMCAFAFLGPGKRLVLGSPTFESVGEDGTTLDAEIVSVPLDQRFAHDLNAMLAKVNESATLVYICNPNNPTGTLTQRKELETFIGKLPDHTYVLIDEAYHHFAGVSQSYTSFIDKPVDNPRLIVSRTFSKVYGLAGVRVGYAVTTQATRERLAPQHLWGSLNIVAARAASAALEDRDHLRLAIKRNADDRQEFFNQAQLRMLKPLDSHTNFYMMDSGRPARQVIDHFEKHNIRIGREFPPLTNYVRISLGLPSEMKEFWRVWDLMPHVEMKM